MTVANMCDGYLPNGCRPVCMQTPGTHTQSPTHTQAHTHTHTHTSTGNTPCIQIDLSVLRASFLGLFQKQTERTNRNFEGPLILDKSVIYIYIYMAVAQYSCFRKTPSSREKKFLSRIFRDSIATPFCLQRALWSHCGCCSCACKHGSRSSLACST